MRNKMICIVMAMLLLISNNITILATGSSNLDGGGGGMGSGSEENYWNPGMEGIRVSIVNAVTGEVIGTSIDYTNKNPTLDYHFRGKNKIQYRNGTSLMPTTDAYSYINPTPSLPAVIGSGGNGSNIEAIKSYFCSEGAAQMIAQDFGMPFETLTNGTYKLLLEPVAYIVFQGIYVGMTAHEAALYDQQLSGGLRSRMASLSHQNLPLSMFLETDDLGFAAYGGSKTGKQSNDTILAFLGLGTVTYADIPNEPETSPPSPTDPPDTEENSSNVEYRMNTEVITMVLLHASSEINPDAPAKVTFKVQGNNYVVDNIVIPEGESQVVWCKWRTPNTEQTVNITITTNKGNLSSNQIHAKIVDLGKNPPPDPKANDRNDSFQPQPVPNNAQKTTARWTIWWARWHPNLVWIPDMEWCDHGDDGHWVDEGEYEDQGWYDFFTDIYTASLTASSTIMPDSKVPTANGKTMGSGYGITNVVQSTFSTNASNSHVTGAQNAISYFPEFGYSTYWRLLDLINNGFTSRLEFKKNQYSTYQQRSHFTPVWMKDGNYVVYTWLIDAWTPDGMLSMNLTDSVTIQKSVFDDWHISPKE